MRGKTVAGKKVVAPGDYNGSGPKNPTTSLNLWGNKSATHALAWADVNARVVTCALAAAAAVDAALMIGVAQGGRGVVLTVFLGSQRAKTYLGTVEEVEEALLELVQQLSSTSEDLLEEFGLKVE